MDDVEKIIRESGNIAVVGISNKLGRPSLTVASYLKGQGYRIIPVNPTIQDVNGEKCYPDLGSIPEKVDVVDIFRKPADVLPVVEEAVRIGAKAVWMQEGIVNEEAARRAKEAGLLVVMDKCMLKEHARLKREGKIE
jgi:predicted CoA-binding protein